jgi:hypothetical protein
MLNLRFLPAVFATVLSAATLQAADESGEVFSITGNGIDRLPASVLDVASPAARVTGAPGSLKITNRSCTSPLSLDLRRRIVDVAVQEWAWFGFLVDDLRDSGPEDGSASFNRRRFMSFDPQEVRRVAPSVGGYWAAAPGSDWILQRQNDSWNGALGLASRWRDPWSAAFISWVMCESGLGDPALFQRAIAHHTYIDQAIRARDEGDSTAVYAAYDPGEAEILPGDLLCSGLRPVYRNLDQRRAQLGVGARTHCDVVVATDVQGGSILTIGGNVRSSVRLKVFPAAAGQSGFLAPLPTSRIIFAHLKLKAGHIENDALQNSAVLAAGACRIPILPEPVAGLMATNELSPTC